ncbi:hypothetical protein JOC76_005921 [Neobacillus cucumis]|nr:hypothetical protein [Neobacillus cucumis]
MLLKVRTYSLSRKRHQDGSNSGAFSMCRFYNTYDHAISDFFYVIGMNDLSLWIAEVLNIFSIVENTKKKI